MLYKQFLVNKEKKNAYVIAEIGNNHQGSIELAFKMVDKAIECGVSAVKFQRRNNKDLFTNEFFNKPYDNPNSFGDVYGTHRQALELNLDELSKLKDYTESKSCDFLVTPFDIKSLEELEKISCQFYKVASADIVHTPMINKMIRTNKPIIMSTGHSNYSDIDRAVEILDKSDISYALLHCTASYPTRIEDMNLSAITTMFKRYPNAINIGLSDHENGIDCASIAYMLGARIFEKHFTLNRSFKGTDNVFSLEPSGMRKLVRNLRRIPVSLGSSDHNILEAEKKPVYKMRKSIVYKQNYNQGSVIGIDDLEFRCPGDGLEPYHLDLVIGRTLKLSVKEHQCVEMSHLG